LDGTPLDDQDRRFDLFIVIISDGLMKKDAEGPTFIAQLFNATQ